MNLLALDTSSLACAVGLAAGARRFIRHAEEERAHTKLLLPMLRSVLEESGLAVGDLDAIVLGNGPGSFIGVRIAASVAAGLGFAARLPVVPVSSLAAVAKSAGAPGETVAVAQDAHLNQVYLGLYRVEAGGEPLPIAPERLQAQAPIAELAEFCGGKVVSAGAGWARYPGLSAANRQYIARASEIRYPAAGALLDLGATAFGAGLHIRPEEVSPAYLRQEVAKAPAATS